MKTSDWITILAVLLAPLLAVQVQKWLERDRDKRRIRMSLFKALMATRATTLAPRHVEALNGIDLEFNEKTDADKKVRDCWKQYLDHLNNFPKESTDKEFGKAQLVGWADKSPDLLAEMLHHMSIAVGQEFDKVHIKKAIYSPQGHYSVETEVNAIRKLTLDVLLGQRSIPMDVVSLPAQNGQSGDASTEKPER